MRIYVKELENFQFANFKEVTHNLLIRDVSVGYFYTCK